MSYGQYLRDLLSPLGVYDLRAPFNGGELDALGLALDAVEGELEDLEREMSPATARSWGLEKLIALMGVRPVAQSPQELAQALAALLRIGGDSFTPQTINDTISGCGVHADAQEGVEPGTVVVTFPDVPGVPVGFEEIRVIIEEILPAHVEIEYQFWYITWQELEERFENWQSIEDHPYTWEELQRLVRQSII